MFSSVSARRRRSPLDVPLVLAAAGLGVLYALRRPAPPYDLHGKSVLITGGSRGLGLTLARQLSAMGARVAICGRDADTLERAEQDLAARGASVLAVRANIAARSEVEDLVARVRARFGRIDVLINNAGIIAVGPIETMTRDDFAHAMDVHFWGALHAILEVLPEMRRRREGRIVNIASIGGKISVPHLLPYGASKFALVGLSEGLGAEVAKDGVRVTTVCPGLMRTGSPRHAAFKGRHRAEYAWFAVSDSLPGLSMDVERAAAEIIAAMRRGDPEVVLSPVARLAALAHGLVPGAVRRLMALGTRLLPRSDRGRESRAFKGLESESWISRSPLTRLTERAARRYNQV